MINRLYQFPAQVPGSVRPALDSPAIGQEGEHLSKSVLRFCPRKLSKFWISSKKREMVFQRNGNLESTHFVVSFFPAL